MIASRTCRPDAQHLRSLRAPGIAFIALAWALSTASLPAFGQTTPPNTPGSNPSTSGSSADRPKMPPLTEDNEVKIGRANAEENDKHIVLVTDAALVERVTRIGNELAAVANTYPIKPLWGIAQLKHFNYTFKIVNDKDVNAYSLPGGFIYVNKGLIDYTRSDDELAAVLAHEISHAAHHHMVKLMKEQSKIQNTLLPALIATLVAAHANGADVMNALNAGYLYTIAKVNGYGVEAEKDADHSGILLMTHTRYNPVAMYSFMIRLNAAEQNKEFVDMGILRNHPPADERVDAARALLEQLHIPLELSKVDPTLLIKVAEAKPVSKDQPPLAEMSIRGIVLCRVAGVDGKTPVEHAREIAQKINAHIDDEIEPFEIYYNKDQNRVSLRGVVILTQEDADAQGKTVEELKKDLGHAIMMINQKKLLESPHT